MIRSIVLFFALAIPACNRSEAAEQATPAAGGRAEIKITVDGKGYHPDQAKAPAGKPVRATFTRISDKGCGEKLVFPELKIERDLPLNVAVPVDFDMPSSGKIAFTCGMDMYDGALLVD